MKKLIEIGDCESPHEKLKLGMLSYSQLQKRYRELSVKLNIQKFDALNLIRKNKILVYQKIRFRGIVSSRDIPRLGTLLQISHNKGMCIQSIIGRIGDTINSKYRVRKFGEDEWDIAYLVLRIGGPTLLHVLHATHGLPAPRSVQSHTRKDSYISGAVDTSFENRIIQNKNNSMFNETSDSIKTLKGELS